MLTLTPYTHIQLFAIYITSLTVCLTDMTTIYYMRKVYCLVHMSLFYISLKGVCRTGLVSVFRSRNCGDTSYILRDKQ